MKKRTEEEDKLLSNGELWESFKNTLYYEELSKFIEDRQKELEYGVIRASMDKRHEDARDLSQQLVGFLMIRDHIMDSISTRVESLQYEKELKDFEKGLPHRL